MKNIRIKRRNLPCIISGYKPEKIDKLEDTLRILIPKIKVKYLGVYMGSHISAIYAGRLNSIKNAEIRKIEREIKNWKSSWEEINVIKNHEEEKENVFV